MQYDVSCGGRCLAAVPRDAFQPRGDGGEGSKVHMDLRMSLQQGMCRGNKHIRKTVLTVN